MNNACYKGFPSIFMDRRDRQFTHFIFPSHWAMESRVLELIICKLMTSFHDNPSPQMEEEICRMVELPRSHTGDSTATVHYFGILPRHLNLVNGTGSIYIYYFEMVFLEKKNSQELHCGNVVNMSFWLVKFLLKMMLLTTCIHAWSFCHRYISKN